MVWVNIRNHVYSTGTERLTLAPQRDPTWRYDRLFGRDRRPLLVGLRGGDRAPGHVKGGEDADVRRARSLHVASLGL